MNPTYKQIQVERIEDGRILRLRLDRPKGNVLSKSMMGELSVALESNAEDQRLKLVLLSAAGRHFSFGASVEEHRKAEAPGMLQAFHRLIRQVAVYPVPIASVVQGSCLGGAFELVLATHFVFATADAALGCPEIRLGVVPPVLAAIGEYRLGSTLAERLLLTGETIGAKELNRTGWLTGIVKGEDDVVDWYRKTLGNLSAFAIRQGVRAARRGSATLQALADRLDEVERQYVTEILESHDGNEGIEAFLARREPQWTDA